jgi:hypothetical protein
MTIDDKHFHRGRPAFQDRAKRVPAATLRRAKS